MKVPESIKTCIYQLLEATVARRGVARTISGCCVRLPVRFARYFPSDYESANIEFIKSCVRPGMVVVDIGAHIGLMSIIMAQQLGGVGRCYSFEPTPSTFRLLKKTIGFNSEGAVVVPVSEAVADRAGELTFHVTDSDGDNSNSLSDNRRIGRGDRPIRVPVTSVDVLADQNCLSRLDFLKIDAEGAEFSVLKGASLSLQRFKPQGILALHPHSILNFGHSLEAIWSLLEEHRYRVTYNGQPIGRDFFLSQVALFDVVITRDLEWHGSAGCAALGVHNLPWLHRMLVCHS